MRLQDSIEKTFRLKDSQKKALTKIGLITLEDLLYYFPSRYNHISEIKNINELSSGDNAVIYGKVLSTKTSKAYRKKIPIGEAVIEDKTGTLHITWFNQAYAAKMIKVGDLVKLAGNIQSKKTGSLYMANPEFEKTQDLPIDVGDSLFAGEKSGDFAYPIYPERKGVTSKFIYHSILKILKRGIFEETKDPIPEKILKKYNLPKLSSALVWIHTPKNEGDARAARKRFAFEEIFYIQLKRQQARLEYKSNASFVANISKKDLDHFISRFPFTPTNAQIKAVEAIRKDLAKDSPMTRLLEGDVGSGKTLVAAATAYATIMTRPEGQDFGNLQIAFMAPTEILAKQHFESFVEYFKHLPINIGLITGSGCKKFPSKVDPSTSTKISRPQLLKWVENGEIAITIGTHSLIQKTVKFKDLAYVIIDEQHRFGNMQRGALTRKDNRAPHLLSMTATPIPRTLALTIYGDLDLTLIDEMPKGRKPIITEIVVPGKRESVYDAVKKELKTGRQVYVICPRIDEPDPDKANSLRVKSVKAEAERLKKNVFQDYEIDILHSKMKPAEKESTMEDFANHDIDILVATSVIEVGVNVPNATIIIIEGAERFGLAQLHQLRGRVLRSEHQAYCYAFADSKASTSINRLKAFKEAKNGFELAELDLKLRGAGELSGTKQWGISDLGMEAIKNIKMVEAARTEAQNLLSEDFALTNHPLIAHQLASKNIDVHFE